MHFLHPTRGCSGLCCTNKAIVHQHYNPPTDCKKLLAQDILPQIAQINTLSLQKNTMQSHKLQNDQGKTIIAKDSFVPLL